MIYKIMCMGLLSLLFCQFCIAKMVVLNDGELSKVSGQALLNLTQKSGVSALDNTTPLNFYKLGVDAVIDINANIKRLQLGCGGANGAGSCDIDIENIALSGLPRNSDGSINTNYTAIDRASSSAKLTNPFIEFAIKNPSNLSTRELVGFRLSAEAIEGLMTLGTENSNTLNGINSLSGYIRTKQSAGTAFTQQRNMTYADVDSANGIANDGDALIKGAVITNGGTRLDYESNEYNLTLLSTRAPFVIDATPISGTRLTANTVVLKGGGTVDPINFSGQLKADTSFLGFPLALDRNVTGRITDLRTDITITQKLGLIHALYLQNPASLSLQKESVLYPGATEAAQRGWWLAIEDELDLGDLSPTAQVGISNQVLLQTIAPISQYLSDNPTVCGSLLGCAFNGSLNVGDARLRNTVLDFPLSDLVLQGQNFRPNCYGNLKFC